MWIWPGNSFKKPYQLLILRARKNVYNLIFRWQDILLGILHVLFELSHKMSCPYTENTFYTQVNFKRSLKLGARDGFRNSSLITVEVPWRWNETILYFNGLVSERRNSIANALELRLSCTKPSICVYFKLLHKHYWHVEHITDSFAITQVEIVITIAWGRTQT